MTRSHLSRLAHLALYVSLFPLYGSLMGINACQTGSTDADGDGYTADQGDCNDNDASAYPGATEQCDGVDNNCDGQSDENAGPTWYADQDGDTFGNPQKSQVACAAPSGYVANRWDCNDANAGISPGSLEVANGIDDDCDGRTDEGTADLDGDTFSVNEGDCDDHSAAAYPGALELCDGIDNDCNGLADDGLSQTWYRDQDGDGFGGVLSVTHTCLPPSGYVAARGDCNDADAAVHPGANDPTGDAKDQDCGGTTGPDPHVGLSSSSYSTLQAALSAAVTGQTLWVGPGRYEEHDLSFALKGVKLASTQLAAATILDAKQAGSALVFNGELSDSVLDGFTVSGGSSACGGVCMTTSSPTLTNCVVSGNVGLQNGGGLSLTNSNPTLTGCTISGNSAANGGGVAASGSSPIFKNCTLIDNSTAGSGGALFLDKSSPTLTNCVMQGNRANYLGMTGEGGAIASTNGSSPVITNSTIVGNYGRDVGGIQNVAGGLTVRNSVLAFNTGYNLKNDGSTVTVAYSDLFGRVGPNHNVTLDGTDLTVDPKVMGWSNDGRSLNDDLHLGSGSPLINTGDPAVTDPDTSRSDMGVYGGTGADASYYKDLDHDGMYDGWEAAHGLSTSSNDANQDTDGDGSTNAKEFLAHSDPRRFDTDGDGSSDGAEATSGTDPNDWYAQPGVTGSATAQIPADFSDLTSALNRIQWDGAINVGNGYYAGFRLEGKNAKVTGAGSIDSILSGNSSSVVVVGNWTTLTLQGFTVTGGRAAHNNGGGIALSQSGGALTDLLVTGNEALYSFGGGIYLAASNPAISRCTIANNKATTYGENGAQKNVGYGGAMYLTGSSPVISDSTISGNTLGTYVSTYTFTGVGAGIYATNATPTISRCVFKDNDAGDGNGGAIYLEQANPMVSGSTFTGNNAHYGGALYLSQSKPVVSNSSFTKNTSLTYGGAAYFYNSDPTLSNCVLNNNTAGGSQIGSGGAFAADASSSPVLTSCALQGNTANYGGAIYAYGASPKLTNCVVTGNVAKSTGGGIYLAAGVINTTVVNSILAYNSNYNFYLNKDNVTGTQSLTYSDFYSAQASSNTNVVNLDSTNKTVEPLFSSYGTDGNPSNLHLATTSTLINIGSGLLADVDGSKSDLGIFGGPVGDKFDLDLDSYPDYFWPGALTDVPTGYSATSYDCNDQNASTHGCP